MAEKPDSRDSESGWVLAGSEGLPVETVGAELDTGCPELDTGCPELDLASPGAEDEDEEEEEGTGNTGTALIDNVTAACSRHPEEGWDLGAAPTLATVEPDVLDNREPEEPKEPEESKEPDTERRPHPDTPKAGSPMDEGSGTSSDDDAEGLWQRQGYEPQSGTPTFTPALLRGTPNPSAEDGLSISKYLLGALALVAVGLLVITGGLYDLADGPMESVVSRDMAAGEQEPPAATEGNDSQKNLPLPDAGDPQSVHSVSLLLDKLAKENQEIRLMQAELQAHKAELQALLRQSEGEAAAAGAQQQALAAENAQLRAALEQEAAALRDARAELQRLREVETPGNPKAEGSAAKQPPTTSTPSRGAAAAQQEHGRLASVRRELAGALERALGPGGLEGLAEELSALEQRLGQELEAEGVESFPKSWKKPFHMENKRHKRHGEVLHERERREHRKPHGKGHREHKSGKTWGKAPHGAPHHEVPPLSRYRAPQGCSGVANCARKEGLEVLGTALEPVQKVQFLQLLEAFMGRLGFGEHFKGVAAQLDGAFGPDGVFVHDRLRFVDFVDDVEELLEDVVRREHGDDEAADGFEEYVLRHYSSVAGKDRGRKVRHHRTQG